MCTYKIRSTYVFNNLGIYVFKWFPDHFTHDIVCWKVPKYHKLNAIVEDNINWHKHVLNLVHTRAFRRRNDRRK